MELLTAISISTIVLPWLLSLMLEPLLSQLRINALAETEGNTNLLPLKARQANAVTWDPDSNTLRFDGAAYPLPAGCTITESDGSLRAQCSSGSSAVIRNRTSKEVLSQHPCGSDLFPTSLSQARQQACREAMR